MKWAGEPCGEVIMISANGSNRKYFRLKGATHQCMAAVNDDVRENEAFFYYAKSLKEIGINVPEVYAVSEDKKIYLQEDLGDVTLYAFLRDKASKLTTEEYEALLMEKYVKVIDDLVKIQTKGRNFDFSHAYPRAKFDYQSIMWDLNYFKYFFLKLTYTKFDEQLLEDDFVKFANYILEEDCSYFLYRDFQARNIMIKEGIPYYIDFQGAREGAAQYDVASLLYSAKSEIPEEVRERLLDYYISKLSEVAEINPESFRHKFYGYVLARIMQAMGAYGYRGFYEKKDYFVKSVPLAVNNMRLIINKADFPIEIPQLKEVWKSITENEEFQQQCDKLSVRIFSFSYKKGLPPDKSGNGGGFVFDCRALPNPGRIEEYKTLTGMDEPVIDFLESEPMVSDFLEHAEKIVSMSIEDYQERGFSSLMVNFGCTGGQHRSVYCAEQMAKFVREKYDCRVVLKHIEQSKK